jgi:hypothetical protein
MDLVALSETERNARNKKIFQTYPQKAMNALVKLCRKILLFPGNWVIIMAIWWYIAMTCR